MRLDIVGLEDMRSAPFHDLAQGSQDARIEGSALPDHFRIDARLAHCREESVRRLSITLTGADISYDAGFDARARQRAELDEILGGAGHRGCFDDRNETRH